MRIVTARVNHETNTFSPVATPLSAFSPQWGKDALAAARGSATAMGAFLDLADELEAQVVTPVFASAFPSGIVASDAYDTLCAAIAAEVNAGCDAILLDLHGAMVVEGQDDGEGALLERLRGIAGSTPIGVALDLHGNVSPRMAAAADIIVGFKTYPHVDMVETGWHVARLVGRMLSDGRRPSIACRNVPVLAQTLCMNTGRPGTMRDVIAAARAAERRKGVQAVSVFGGFPLSDIAEAGMSVVAVADDAVTARQVCDDLAALLWERRKEFVYLEEPLATSISAAKAAAAKPGKGPVLLLDHGDNCMSGGTCDTMDVLAEALDQGLDGIAAGPICDPLAVDALHRAGRDAEVEIEIGNRYDLSALGNRNSPLRLRGHVRWLGDGSYVISGPTYTGMTCHMGRCAVLDIGSALILLSERTHEPWDIGVFACAGIDPAAFRFLILKSRMYCRPVFEPLARSAIDCASLGVTSSDYRLFPYAKLRRPIYPLDPDYHWEGGTSS